MTARSPTYLKSVFENADIPQQADYGDIFDSFLPILATGRQVLDISLAITGDFSAESINTNSLNVGALSISALSTNSINTNEVSASSGRFHTFTSDVISASSASINYLTRPVVSSVAAAGTATAGATRVSAAITVINAITTGSQECVILKRAMPGSTQFIINGTNASAKVFPTSASKFNGQSNGASFDLAQSRTLQVFHITSAQYYTATLTR